MNMPKSQRHTSKNAITEGDLKCIFACNCEGTQQLQKYERSAGDGRCRM